MCFVYGIEETTSVDKTSIISFGIKNKQLYCEKLFISFLLLLGKWPRCEAF